MAQGATGHDSLYPYHDVEEHRLMEKLREELRASATAEPREFVPLDADRLIAAAKARRKSSRRQD